METLQTHCYATGTVTLLWKRPQRPNMSQYNANLTLVTIKIEIKIKITYVAGLTFQNIKVLTC
jgi:hypothetical protein